MRLGFFEKGTDMEINERDARSMLINAAVMVLNDASDNHDNNQVFLFGMIKACENLGLISQSETDYLNDHLMRGYFPSDFEDDFVDGIYRFAPSIR